MWIDVKDRMPEVNTLVLVRLIDSSNPALAMWDERTQQWDVQPMYDSWFVTESFVTHWRPIPED